MAQVRNLSSARYIGAKAAMSARFNLIWSCRWGSNTTPPPSAPQILPAHASKSGAVILLIGNHLRQNDVDSMNNRRTPTTTLTPGCRTSTTATRTTTTSRTSTERVQSADQMDMVASHAEPLFSELVQAYFDCRKNKRNTPSALAFEQNLERNLIQLHEDLSNGTYTPGKSICFVVTRPKAREVWAADFRDRIVHHLLYNRVAPRFYASFIADSCACIPGRGTLYASNRLASKIRSASQNWSKPTYYLKCDLANFFVSIDKRVLQKQLDQRINEPFWRQLTHTILWHDPRKHVEIRGEKELLAKVPPHKRLTEQPAHLGLPIGNLSSQFFANVYLNALDQYIKHQIGARHYIRYVDDFVLLHDSADWLNAALADISAWLPATLGARLNDSKTILQPVARGVDFVGHVIRPWHTRTRKRTTKEAVHRIENANRGDVFTITNSYLGLIRQASASHHDQALIAKAAMRRGFSVSSDLNKIYQIKGS